MSNCSDSNSANALPKQYDVVLMITSLHEMYLQYLTKGTAFQDKNKHGKINVTNVNKLKLVSETISGLSKEISGLSKEISGLNNERRGRIAVLDVGCGKVPYQKEAIDIFTNIDIKFYCIDNDENAFPEGFKNQAEDSTFIFQKADFLTKEIGCDIPNKTNFLNSVFSKVSSLLKDNGCFVLIEFYYPKWIDHSQAKDTLDFLRKEVEHADSQVLFFTPEQYCFTAKKFDFRIKDVRIVTSSYNAETEKGNAETEKDGRLLGAYHFQKNNLDEAKTGKENISNIDDTRYSWIETNSNFAKALGKFIIEKAGSISEERLNEILLKGLVDDSNGQIVSMISLKNVADTIKRLWNEWMDKNFQGHPNFNFTTIWVSLATKLFTKLRISDKIRVDPKISIDENEYYRGWCCVDSNSANEQLKCSANEQLEWSMLAFNYLLSPEGTVWGDENKFKFYGPSIHQSINFHNQKSKSVKLLRSVLFSINRNVDKIYTDEGSRNIQNIKCFEEYDKNCNHHKSFVCFESDTNDVYTIGKKFDEQNGNFLFVNNEDQFADKLRILRQNVLSLFLDFVFLGRNISSEDCTLESAIEKFKQRWDREKVNFIKDIKDVNILAQNNTKTNIELPDFYEKKISQLVELVDKNADSFHVFPLYWHTIALHSVKSDVALPTVMLFTDELWSVDYIEDVLVPLMSFVFTDYAVKELDIINDYHNWKLKLSNIKSAIGSIMSRNGSHNIGSHVLAALSHNVGTLPDDRVLYQYIQQRMDYIATVTTDFPTWTQPTMFVADMMKTFLSQRHLLDHIVESEGLHAFQFQNPNMTDEEWADQKNCVKIHVRKVDGKKKKDFIEYEKGKRETEIDLTNDVALAIPGGIIGEHAFYTILENIIRNAAKHAWTDEDMRGECKNLDLYIDFREDCQHNKIIFDVYAALPIKGENRKISLSNAKIKLWSSKYDKVGGLTPKEQEEFDTLPIHYKQQVMLARPFIDSQGALRRENWGMAEMKISAGYLAGESIAAIGGIRGVNDIIKPYIKFQKKNDKCKVKERYLAYQFSIAKPKEILIVVISKKDWGGDSARKELEKVGVFVKTVDEIKQEKRLNYRYVVHYDANELFDENYQVKDGILLPFRVLSGKEIKGNRLKKFIPTICMNKIQGYIKNINEEITESAIKAAKKDIEQLIYTQYRNYLKDEQNKTRNDNDKINDIGLLVAINENEKSGGNSLISDADILELMLEQNFAVCVDQYKAFAANEDNRKIIKCLESIRYKSSAKDKVIKFKHFSNKTIRELIAQRMCDWAEKSNDSWIPIVEHLRKKYFVSDAEGETPNELKPSSNKTFDDFEANVNSLLQKHPIDDFIRYVESIFENTKKLFKQYEEQIVTLPAGYKIDTSSEVKQGDKQFNNKCDASKEIAFDGVEIVTNIEGVKNKDRHWIGYRRHAHTINGCRALYVEPLSGTQTYLSQLTKVKNDLGLQMRLIENGLMRILVLDERVAKFLREHQKEVGPHYKAMNINVIDDKWVESGSKADSDPDGFFSGYTMAVTEALKKYAQNVMTMSKKSEVKNDKEDPSIPEEIKNIFGDIDILIVHQGILDKWFTDLKSVEGMKHLLEGFKRLVKYVVVTTGRGTPENIPEEAHLLPFAVVESTLFKKYPEKLILTDTIMNVLPVGKKNDNSGGQE